MIFFGSFGKLSEGEGGLANFVFASCRFLMSGLAVATWLKLASRCLLSMLLFGFGEVATASPEEKELENSLVRLAVTFQKGSAYTPWKWQSPSQRSGQGLVVGDNLVLTLASMVVESRMIEARLKAEPSPTMMKVKHLDLDRGLALLEGDLPEGAKVITLPEKSDFKRGATVRSYWKTDGGRFMEAHATLDRAESALVTDSYLMQYFYEASNVSVRGGYGEPIFLDGQMIGIGLKNGGGAELSILPVEMIHLRYSFPSGDLKPDTAMSGFVTSPCTQRNLRRSIGLKDDDGGCIVVQVMEQGSGHEQLQVGDVLLSFGGHALDAWGRYKDEQLGWLSWESLLSEMSLDRSPVVDLVRDGKRLQVKLNLSTIDEYRWLIPPERLGQTPKYFVRGGYVFQSLSIPFLQAWGRDWRKKAPDDIILTLDKMGSKIATDEMREIIVLSQVLSHPVNMGHHNRSIGRKIVHELNGSAIESLSQLKTVLDRSTEPYVELALGEGKEPLLLPPEELKLADPDISKWYGITRMSSID